MEPALRKKLIAAAGGGAVAIAVAFGAYFEGTGPTRKMPDGSLQYQSYRDTGKVWTVCHGVTGPAVVPYQWYTQDECDELESAAYTSALRDARALFPRFDRLNYWQQAALLDMTYNLGRLNLEGSTLRRKLNAGDVAGACAEMTKWVKGRVNGQLVTLGGLVRRRAASQELCMGGVA